MDAHAVFVQMVTWTHIIYNSYSPHWLVAYFLLLPLVSYASFISDTSVVIFLLLAVAIIVVLAADEVTCIAARKQASSVQQLNLTNNTNRSGWTAPTTSTGSIYNMTNSLWIGEWHYSKMTLYLWTLTASDMMKLS